MNVKKLNFLIVGFVFVFSSCSGPYLKNRTRDLADVFTVELQTQSYGAAIYLGPLALGLNHKSQEGLSTGLRGGQVTSSNSAGFTFFAFGADYLTEEKINFEAVWKPVTKDSQTQSNISNAKDALDVLNTKEDDENDVADEDENKQSLLALRKKNFRARVPFGTVKAAYKNNHLFKNKKTQWAPAYYYSRIEIQLGLYFGIRIGFNPGELVDFFVGLLGFDPYDDDAPYEDTLEQRLRKHPQFEKLPESVRRQLIEKIRQNPSATLPF